MGVMEEILAELKKLNATMSHIGVAASAPPPPTPNPAADVKAEKPKAEKPKAEKPAPAPAAPAEKAAFDYADVSAATKAKVTAGKRAEVVALLASYGVKHGQDLKPEVYSEYMAKLAAL